MTSYSQKKEKMGLGRTYIRAKWKRWAYYIKNWYSKEGRKKGNGKFCQPFSPIHSV